MAYIALYWSAMFIGYLLGGKISGRISDGGQKALGTVMLACISALVFLMGMRMGANEEVIANLGAIGLQALLISAMLMAGTVFFVFLARKAAGLDRYGILKKTHRDPVADEPSFEDEISQEDEKSSNLMTWMIVMFTILGLAFGYFVIRVRVSNPEGMNDIVGMIMTAGLTLMLFVIGLDMGITGTVGVHLKQIGFRVLIFPAVMIVGTAVSGVVIGLVFPSLTVREALAICFGFGWYTFAPVTISNAGHAVAGAISFLHNVIREMGGIVLIPVLAKRIGYIEVTSLPGVAAMDICMPIVGKATRPDIMVYSFTMGIAANLAVPLFVPLFLGI